ncbi:flavin reductase family protein [Methanobacterium alcaliphilum]|uniref:flavin reductase family protein n=1 Tax=Methanobacterium alcaliphilum TaxID=392018 RepID=UPI00200B04CE|nr:flavin reductase family protein [Methanobacterium alcaliphilum]MCK9152286.1 flavin reductase family protein [Methanobacterium alcaliphilum]
MKKSIGANTIVYPTPVFIIGTYDENNKPNAMNAAWGGISCSVPPCVSISLREATYTHGNILNKKAFTVNIPSEKYIKEADYFGIASGKNEDKFEATGLTPIKSEKVDAPYIDEFPFVLECELVNVTELGLHTHFTGEIKDIKVDENLLKDGKPDINQIKPMLYDPSFRTYHGIGKLLGKAFLEGKSFIK